MTAQKLGRKGRRGTAAGGLGQYPLGMPRGTLGEGRHLAPLALFFLSLPLLAAPDSGLASISSSWVTYPLVWSNVLAADHHPGQCQKAVAQVADLERTERDRLP